MRVHDQPAATRSCWLALGGLLMLVALLFQSDPFADGGRWPWETFQTHSDSLQRTVMAIWAGLGLVALFSAFGTSFGTRATILVTLAAVLWIALAGGASNLGPHRTSTTKLLLLAALGGGLLGTLHESTRGAGRWTAAIAALLLLATFVLSHDTTAASNARLQGLWNDAVAWGEQGWTGIRAGDYASLSFLPDALAVLAAALALLVALGATNVWFVTFVVLLLTASIFAPGILDAFKDRADATDLPFTMHVSNTLIAWGGALWVLGVALVRDLLPRRTAV